MPQGLPRKIRIAFLLQVVLVSLAVVIAGWLVSLVIRVGFIRSASEAEAADYFAQKAVDASYQLPHGRNFKSWFVRDGYIPLGLPPGVVPCDSALYRVLTPPASATRNPSASMPPPTKSSACSMSVQMTERMPPLTV